MFKAKKLTSTLINFLFIARASMKNILKLLDWRSCIYYLFCFQKNTKSVKALIDSRSKINAITSEYTSKLSFKVRFTNVKAQKIDSSSLKTFKIVLASF